MTELEFEAAILRLWSVADGRLFIEGVEKLVDEHCRVVCERDALRAASIIRDHSGYCGQRFPLVFCKLCRGLGIQTARHTAKCPLFGLDDAPAGG